ncbi:MAG: hypothetical protein P3T54_00200 [Dehalogenimonas sp.]|nr:hypothetical protein [Dehalogenimonas sp.]
MGSKSNVLVGSAVVSVGGTPVGYTVDGVEVKISTDVASIKVDEVAGAVKRVIVGQTCQVTLKMAEGSLANMAKAIPGASVDGAVMTIGGGSLQDTALTVVGVNPAGFARTYSFSNVNPVGEVGVAYKKGEISIVPVTFDALASDAGVFGTMTDAAA